MAPGSHHPVRALLALAGACLLVSPVKTQIGGGALTGTITDQQPAAVPGATVTVTAAGTARTRTVVTGADGSYSMSPLAPGIYQVRVELTGFRTLVREGIRLTTGETVRLD